MRDLTHVELEAVGGGIQAVPMSRPRITLRTLILAVIRRILDPRPRAPLPVPQK
jgi:hypothetical protein